MDLSTKGRAFIQKEEGVRLKAYKDAVGVWTIGYGNTYYQNGTKVKEGDTITKEESNQLFSSIVSKFSQAVNRLVIREINQNQFDALVSLTYNIGIVGFTRSSVLKKVNKNPCDPTIGTSFELWKNAGGKPILLDRRKREVSLYTS